MDLSTHSKVNLLTHSKANLLIGLFPDQKRASSLYKKIDLKYRADLNTESIIKKIAKQKEKGSLGN